MIQPFVIAYILKYFEGDIGSKEAFSYGLILCGLMTLRSIVHHPYFLYAVLFGQRTRIACFGLIYK
jgi:hypothetical protein